MGSIRVSFMKRFWIAKIYVSLLIFQHTDCMQTTFWTVDKQEVAVCMGGCYLQLWAGREKNVDLFLVNLRVVKNRSRVCRVAVRARRSCEYTQPLVRKRKPQFVIVKGRVMNELLSRVLMQQSRVRWNCIALYTSSFSIDSDPAVESTRATLKSRNRSTNRVSLSQLDVVRHRQTTHVCGPHTTNVSYPCRGAIQTPYNSRKNDGFRLFGDRKKELSITGNKAASY